MTVLVAADTSDSPAIAGVSIYPADNIWNTPVDQLPPDPHSADYISKIGSGTPLHPDFGSGLWEGHPIGIPYNIVSGSQPRKNVIFDYASESDTGPYPIPDNVLVEGGSDHHILLLDSDNAMLYELYAAREQQDGTWQAGSGAVFNLKGYTLRPAGWTSADAAGLPILPGLVRYDEVKAGEINHAIRFTAPSTQRAYVWPARHYASSITDYRYPPMGQRFRLKSSFDTSGYAPDAKVILDALKKYGMILADNGGAWFISGAPDERWDNNVLNTLKQVKGSDFEAVDSNSLIISPDSGQAKTKSPTPTPTVTFIPTPTPTTTPDMYSLQLYPGWNFISTPKTLASGSNTASIFSQVDMGGHSAYMWDGSQSPGHWNILQANTPVLPLYGIWIYSASAKVVHLNFDTNPMVTPAQRSLPAGWNTVGFTGLNPTSARNTYLGVQSGWVNSMGFHALTQSYEPTIFNGDVSESTVLYPTKGYWLYMRAPGTLPAIGV